MSTLAEVFRTYGAAYLSEHTLSAQQSKVWRAIISCRTAALGGHRIQCESCAYTHHVYHSCRNRHCPQCQTRTKEAWVSARIREILPVPYCHLVFTLPHALNHLARFHPVWVYDTLFNCVAQTLTEFAANPRWIGGKPAFTLVLHTWSQDLGLHIHIHALMACGALNESRQWQNPVKSARFIFPVFALSRVFRAKFMDALDQARSTLCHDPQASPELWARRRAKLLKHEWVVYAKSPLGGAQQVLEYLSRYTHRVAISNERILGIHAKDVALRIRANDQGVKRIIKIPGTVFIKRFLQHILPNGYKRIRHYGLLASASKKQSLLIARSALNAPIPDAVTIESIQDFMLRVAKIDISICPLCKQGHLRIVEILTKHAIDSIAKYPEPP